MMISGNSKWMDGWREPERERGARKKVDKKCTEIRDE